MRLINVDKLVNDIAEHITVKAVSRVLAIIQGQPTVEAIPKEWIRDYMLRLPDGSEAYECILVMLENWEKENGTEESNRNI